MDLIGAIAEMRRRGGELPGVEVKSAAGGLPDSVTETLSAFANLPGGGIIVLGLDEAAGFKPVGLTAAPALAAGLASRARQGFEPELHADIDVERFEGADLVVARVRELPASAKPCIVRRTGRSYLRFADGDYPLSQLEIDAFISNRTHPRFDEAPVIGSTQHDLEADRVDDFVHTARSTDHRLARISDDEELLRRLGVIDVGGTPSVAGLIALGEYPQQFLPHYNIRAAASIADQSPTIRAFDQATFTGPIAVILDEAVAWTARNSRQRLVTDTTTGHVRDYLDPPGQAVRELVSNALVHRDLAEWATSRAIELRLTPDTFRITNPGGLYGITAERLGIHPLTSARNRRLVEICKFIRTSDGRAVEALASGIPTALNALRQAGMSDLDFFDQGITFTVAIDRTTTQPRRSPTEPTTGNTLLAALDNPKTVAELSTEFGISENAVRKRLEPLRKKGLVTLTGGRGQRTTYQRTARS